MSELIERLDNGDPRLVHVVMPFQISTFNDCVTAIPDLCVGRRSTRQVLHIFRREDLSKMKQPILILSALQGLVQTTQQDLGTETYRYCR